MGDLEGYKIDYEDPLGSGSYGTVYKAKNLLTKDFVAAKRIIVNHGDDLEDKLKAIRAEIEHMKQLGSHINIIEWVKNQEFAMPERFMTHFWIVTEFCSLGDLYRYAWNYYLTTGNRLDIMLQSARGLAFMHKQKPPIIHRNIKPANILMIEENGKHVVKQAGFGLSRTFSNTNSHSVQTMTTAGTLCFMAPELIDEEIDLPHERAQYNKSGAQDSWAHGLVSYQLVSSDPRKGIECPEVTDTIIGKVMIMMRDIEADIKREKEKWTIEMRRDSGLGVDTVYGCCDKETENKLKAIEEEIAIREKNLRIELWKRRRMAQFKRMKPTKDWDPIIIHESDSDVVKEAKRLIRTQVRFNPRERSTMSYVVEQLESIMKMLPAQPTIPRLTTDVEKELVKSQQLATDKEKSLQEPDFTCKTVPKMVKCFSHQLGFDSFIYIGFSSDYVDVKNNNEGKIVKYMHNVDKCYRKVCEKPLPAGVRSHSRMFVLSNSNIVFRHDDDNVTIVCDGDLNPIHTHTGDYGWLCGVVRGKLLVYCKKSGLHMVLDIYDYESHNHVRRLPAHVRSEYICTASHPASGWFVIIDQLGQTMYMFTSDYQLHTQVQLDFVPYLTNAVCCVRELIAVVREDGEGIHWYTWAGEPIHSVTRREMGVGLGIAGVGVGGEGRMQVLTRDYDTKQHDLYMFMMENITPSVGGAEGGASK